MLVNILLNMLFILGIIIVAFTIITTLLVGIVLIVGFIGKVKTAAKNNESESGGQ